MGRKLRVDFDGACHHIVVKAINSHFIFDETFVKDRFIDLLKKYQDKHDINLFAYCLMDNHIHLFVQSGKPPKKNQLCISAFMRDLLSNFARWYNKINDRTGPLFNGRFKSFLCQSTPYLIYLLNYIHRNPFVAGMSKTYHYAYSSFKNFVTGKGICDIEACCEHIDMSREELLSHLEDRMTLNTLPFLDKVIEKIKDVQNNQSLKDILSDLSFDLKEFKGHGIAIYHQGLRNEMMKALREARQMKASSIAELFNVSKTYVYNAINSE